MNRYKSLLLFSLIHGATCLLIAVGIFIIIGGDGFLEVSAWQKTIRVLFAVLYLFGIVWAFVRFLRYFTKYADVVILLKMTVYFSIPWFVISGCLLKAYYH